MVICVQSPSCEMPMRVSAVGLTVPLGTKVMPLKISGRGANQVHLAVSTAHVNKSSLVIA